MTDKARNFWWPSVETMEDARKARMYGVWAAVFSGAVTSLFAAWALSSGKAVAGFVDASAFIDAALFFGLAFGIYKGSRIAAVACLLLFVFEKVYQVFLTGKFQGAYMAIILTFCYVVAVRGTFAMRRHQEAGLERM